MKYDVSTFKLVEKYQLTKTIFDFRLKNEKLANLCKPGTFVHIAVPGKTLRRPISVCDVYDDILRIVFEIRGEGTEILSNTKTGESLDILAPLGKGFELDSNKKTVFIGGGIGVPPMLYASKICGKNGIVITGFRNKDAVILQEDFAKNGSQVILTTDDGSAGIKGFVTQALQDVIDQAEMICACGPIPMLKAIAKIADNNNIPCQVSLEERMACGIGACLGCAVLVNKDDGTQIYKHVCKDGPVFSSKEVVW